jgi:hypothetical protein
MGKKSASMVQSVVVKGGGKASLTCEQIFALFDPPIEFGAHKDMQGTKDGYQAEHIVPTSAFHVKGRGGDAFDGCGNYATSDALTWMVSDKQHQGQEHKLLTDPMRKFSQQNDLANKNAPLSKWLDKYEEGARDALKNGQVRRKIKDPTLDRDDLIDKAAKCIRARAEKSFKDAGIPLSTPLRNPWPATNEMREAQSALRGQTSRRLGR